MLVISAKANTALVTLGTDKWSGSGYTRGWHHTCKSGPAPRGPQVWRGICPALRTWGRRTENVRCSSSLSWDFHSRKGFSWITHFRYLSLSRIHLEVICLNASVGDHDCCEFTQDYPGLKQEVQLLRFHQLLLLHLCRIIDVFEVLVTKIEDLGYWDKINQERRQVQKYENLLSRTGSFMPLGIHQLLFINI